MLDGGIAMAIVAKMYLMPIPGSTDVIALFYDFFIDCVLREILTKEGFYKYQNECQSAKIVGRPPLPL